MLKRIFLLLFLLSTTFGLKAQDNRKIRVCWPDGSYSMMSFDNSCRLSYGDASVNILTPEGNVSFSYDEIVKIDFVNLDPSHVSSIKEPNTKLHISNGTVTVTRTEAGTQCLLYNMVGTLLKNITADGNSDVLIDLHQFNDNIFILFVGNHSFKIAK